MMRAWRMGKDRTKWPGEFYGWGGGSSLMWICPVCRYVIIASRKEIYAKIAEHMEEHE